MDVKLILKNHPQQIYGKIIPVDIQCLRYGHLGGIENKHDVYRGKSCIKTFCEF